MAETTELIQLSKLFAEATKLYAALTIYHLYNHLYKKVKTKYDPAAAYSHIILYKYPPTASATAGINTLNK